MSFSIQVVVDPGSSKSTIDGLTSSLSAAEAAGPRAGAAISSGLREVTDSSQRAKQGIAALDDETGVATTTMDKFNRMIGVGSNNLDAEGKMLDKIHGPLAKYTDDLITLEALLQKGAIDAGQFADAMTRVNRTYESATPRSNAGFDSTKANTGGFGIADAAQIAAATAIGAEMIHLGDAYTLAANSAQRLTAGGKGIDQVLAEQLAMSEKLHGSLQTTIGLTAALEVGTAHMNLTTRERNTLEKSLAETVQISGRSLDDAAALFKKVEFAAEQGSFAPRELRAIFKEFPAVSEEMQAGLGKTQAQLLEMAKAGKITAETFVQVQLAQAGAIDAKFANQVETTSQAFQHFKNTITLSVGGFIASSGAASAFGSVLGGIADILGGFVGGVKHVQDALGGLDSALQKFTGGQFHLGAGTALGFIAGGPLGAAIGTVTQGVLEATSADKWPAYAYVIAKVRAEEAELAKTSLELADAHDKLIQRFKAGNTVIEAVAVGIASANKVLAMSVWQNLENNAHQALGRMLEDHKKAAAAAAAAWAHVFGDATGPAQNFGRDLGLVHAMLKDHVLTANQAAIETEKLVASFAGGDMVKMIDQIRGTSMAAEAEFLANEARAKLLLHDKIIDTDTYAKLLEKINALHDASTIPRSVTGGSLSGGAAGGNDPGAFDSALGNATANSNAAKVQDEITKAMAASKNEIAKYQEEVIRFDQSLKGLTIDAGDHEKVIASIKLRYDDMKSPLEKFAEGEQLANDKLKIGIYNLDEYERAMRKLRETAGTSTWADGVADGVEKIRKEVNNLSGDVSTTLVNAFHGVNDAIVNMVTTGQFSFDNLVKGLEKDLVTMALHKIEGSLFQSGADAASKAAGGGAAGAAIAASMTTAGVGVGATIASSFLAAGSTVAAELAASMATGGGGGMGGGMGGLMSLLGGGGGAAAGGADGGAAIADILSTTIFAAANGGQGFVGGTGGTDSQIVAFRATPGEHVAIRTPEQQMRDARGSSSGEGPSTVQNFHYHDHGDPRGLAPLQKEMRDLREMVKAARGGR